MPIILSTPIEGRVRNNRFFNERDYDITSLKIRQILDCAYANGHNVLIDDAWANKSIIGPMHSIFQCWRNEILKSSIRVLFANVYETESECKKIFTHNPLVNHS